MEYDTLDDISGCGTEVNVAEEMECDEELVAPLSGGHDRANDV
jgi:hypothetical protein